MTVTDWTAEEERVARAIHEATSIMHWEQAPVGHRWQCVHSARAAISAMQPRWRDVKTDPPPPNVSLLLFEPETPGRAGAIVVGMARWGWDNEVARNWSENPWATHWMLLPPAPETSDER